MHWFVQYILKKSISDFLRQISFRLLFNIEIYFQGEAVRVARSLSSRMNRSEVDELLSRMEKEIPLDLRKCVHDRPFFLTIAQIPE